jgi:hypothetical protein
MKLELATIVRFAHKKGESCSFFSGFARKMNHFSSFFASEASKKDAKTDFD